MEAHEVMKLSDIPAKHGLRVARDSAFETLGFVSYETDGLLVFLESEAYLPQLSANERITAAITTAALAEQIPSRVGVAVAENPRAAFYAVHTELAAADYYWKPFRTEISSSAKIHPRAYVAEWNVRIGDHCIVEPHATILERCILDEEVVVRAGSVIGSEGFQFPIVDGVPVTIKHVGGVHLARGVELQACTCVDLAVFGGFTEVGEYTKTDNRVHIAHNCRLGKRNRLAAAAMLSGSVVSGDDVWFGPSCAISDGIRIGAGASITIGAVVTRDVPAGAKVSGNFAIDHGRFIAHMKAIR
jgi:UDP-3-O-[3-hydroxymyristoyl] glucosamine N-acyltransferase